MPSSRSNLKPKPEPAPPEPIHDWSFEAIGTHWWIGLYEPVPDDVLTELQTAVERRIDAYDQVYSRFQHDSLVARIAQRADSYDFPADSEALFDWYRQLYDVSGGQVTPLIGQMLSDAGYDTNYSLRPGKLAHPPAWDEVMRYQNGRLKTKRPVLLDFGAAGKGHLVDIICELLVMNGISKFCVDAGGDMRCAGLAAPLRIGLEHPDNFEQVIGVAELQGGALCASAGNRRKWSKYNHIFDPLKLESLQHISAVWVAAADTLTADGLTTALYFVSPKALHERFRFEHCIMYADGSVQASVDFPATLFTKATQ